MQFNGVPSRGKIGDPTSVVALKRAEIEMRLKNTERLVKIVDRALGQLEGIEKEVVIRRYVNGQPWKRIADECYYSRKGAWQAGQRGLKKTCKNLFG
jgi:DNA-directed RNA polymerase specialized sigma24 family protein